ncbi:MAG: isoprenylcysteine carboxylmethyltransferase family protein [Kiritimatiellae bacterium]|nr:isoprenylcysteine carboxylmethyltransferase family protein [Kiritimatiellia bacterium]MDD4340655.1 isoprenylcysteine carboxylmethyltransferase family protein [Kiritimatiellia bacterium]
MKRPTPPVYVWTAFGAMLAAHFLVPIRQILSFPWTLWGAVPLLVGAALAAYALRIFRRHRTTPTPFGRPHRLVTSGPFRFSRNPMYLGILLMLSGVAGLLGTATPWLVIPALGALFAVFFIRQEEKQLEITFKDTYRRYCSRVRRWL